MEDAALFESDNAIEDPILWTKGTARCDGVAALWPTMRFLSCLTMLSASSISKWNTVLSSGVQLPSKFLERWWNHLGCIVRHCPAARPIWKDVMGVPWDSLLDIAWDVLAPVRVSRNRERRGCFSFNVRHFQQTDCLLVHYFLLLFIHVWKWFGHSMRWSWRRFRQAKATTCVWHFVGNS